MYGFPWYLNVLIGLDFLIAAAAGVALLILVFWFVKLLQAAVRALDRWQPASPARSNGAPASPPPQADDARYQPRQPGRV